MISAGIIGGGIAGLAAAYRLKKESCAVHLFEARSQAGGVIRSERDEGYLIEHGPNTLQSSTAVLDDLLDELGLNEEIVTASKEARKRFIVIGHTPVALPTSILDVLDTPLFSLPAKLRLFIEPLIRKSTSEQEESVASFTRRRLGREALEYVVNPFVGGVFAGDPENLSLQHAFPRFHQLEQKYGSVIVGQIRERLRRAREKQTADGKKPAAKQRGLFSFRNGMQTLPDALSEQLGDSIQYDTRIERIAKEGDQWRLQHRSGDAVDETLVDAVIYAAPLYRLPDLLSDASLDLAPVKTVPHPPVSVLALGFHRDDVRHPLDGFGLLVPQVESHLRILGTLFPSSIFPNRAPKDHVLLTTFIGGARNPDLARADTNTLQRIVRQDLNRLIGVQGPPVFSRHIFWERAIPQYTIGYGKIKRLLKRLEEEHAGLHLAGSYRQGVSVVATLESGHKAALRALKGLPA